MIPYRKAARPKTECKPAWWQRGFRFYADNLAALSALFAVIALLLAAMFSGASLLYPLNEIAFRGEELAQKRAGVAQQQAFAAAQQQLADRYLALANAFLDRGLYDEAKRHFEEVLKYDKTSVKADFGMLKSGIFALSNGVYAPEVIEQKLQFVLQNEPEEAHALTILGQIYADLEPQKAMAYFNRALASNANVAPAYDGRGLLLQAEGSAKLREAARQFALAVEKSPWNSDYRSNYADVLEQLGKTDQALAQYRYVNRLDGDFLRVYMEAARLLLRHGSPSEAWGYVGQLQRLLADPTLAAMKKNSGIWFWYTDDRQGIELSTLKQKQDYTRHTVAIAAVLAGYTAQHAANDAPLVNDAAVLRLVQADVKVLASLYPKRLDELNAYLARLR